MSNQENDIESRGSCCQVRGQRCVCLPYNHWLVVTSSSLSIAAFALTLIWWWTTFLIGLSALIGMIVFQLLWCCRQTSSTLYIFTVVAGLCSIAAIGRGIFIVMETNDYYDVFDVMSLFLFVCGFLWATIACFTFCFVKSGRHALMEEKYRGNSNNRTVVVVELGTLPDAPTEPPLAVAVGLGAALPSRPIASKSAKNKPILATAVVVDEGSLEPMA